MLLSGDVREDVRELLGKELAKLRKKQDAGETVHEGKIDSVDTQLISLDNGLERPFLSLIGFTKKIPTQKQKNALKRHRFPMHLNCRL